MKNFRRILSLIALICLVLGFITFRLTPEYFELTMYQKIIFTMAFTSSGFSILSFLERV